LHLDDLANALSVFFDVLDAVIVFNDSRDTEVKAAEDDLLLDVLDECQYVGVNAQRSGIYNISIDEGVADALPRITQYLVVQLCGALVYLSILGHIVHDFLVKDIHASHLLVNLWQKLNILRCILNHCRGKRSLLPEFGIALHLVIDFILLGIDLTKILFQQIVKADIDVPIVIVLQKV